MKKFKLTDEFITFSGKKLFRIKALIDFGDVKAGDLGGYIEKEGNLSHNGNAWVYDNAKVCGNAMVCDNARVCCDADYLTIGPIGSRDGTVTFMKSKDNKIIVKCDWFTGDIDAFISKVKETHGDNEHCKAYLLAAEMAKVRIKLKEGHQCQGY